MGKDKAGDYVQREPEEPIQKVVDDKLNDPAIATKQGERDATKVLQEGAAKSLKEKVSDERSHGPSNGQGNSFSVQSAYDWVANTARSNPVLVVGGALAVGALMVMVVSSRKSNPPTPVRAFERRIRRDIASAEKALRKSYDKSGGFLSGLAELPSVVASRLGTWDPAQLEALKDRAGQVARLLTERASSFMRSRN